MRAVPRVSERAVGTARPPSLRRSRDADRKTEKETPENIFNFGIKFVHPFVVLKKKVATERCQPFVSDAAIPADNTQNTLMFH